MKRCPITYEVIADTARYSERGLHLLSPQLQDLLPLAYTADDQRKEAIARAGKMSIQGVQTKLSAQLKVKQSRFELVDQFGHYILKPPSEYYAELPANEAISMTLASMVGIEVPVHGLVYAQDGSMTYFVKRFDRAGHSQKLALEDFSQLSQFSRETKYKSSMEKVAEIILNPNWCSFPKVEAAKFFKLTLFNFLIGNEDMHLKNFSLIRRGKIVSLSPGYDLLNTTIALRSAREEMALPLNGKKRGLTRKDLIDYYAKTRLQLNDKVISGIRDEFVAILPEWHKFIGYSFLSSKMHANYLALLEERSRRLL